MLYYLSNETILWSEGVEVTNGWYAFDAYRTVVIQTVKQGNQVGLTMAKLSEGAFKPKTATVPISSIVMITDCTDKRVLTQLKATLSGIIIPGKN